MLSWASQQLEKISQQVAPPPTEPIPKFVHFVSRRDEAGAMEALGQIGGDAASVVVQPQRGTQAIHLACQHGMTNIVTQLLNSSGAHAVNAYDLAGNTVLHYACMSSNSATTLQLVQMLVTQYQASVVQKNASGQTPYDIAVMDKVRQYLLPLQLQEETRVALANGGVGLPPGIDLGGLKIANSHLPPPPTGMNGPPGGAPPPIDTSGANTMRMSSTTSPYAVPSYAQYGQTNSNMFATPSPHPPITQNQGSVASPPSMSSPTSYSSAQLAPAAGASEPVLFEPSPSFVPPSTSGNNTASAMQLPKQPANKLPSRSQSAVEPLTHTRGIPSAPRSQGSDSSSLRYARTGSSSAALSGFRKPDGFHSSSSDANLQKKYGHVERSQSASALPPPPTMSGASAQPIGTFYSSQNQQRRSTYLAYDARTGQVSAPSSGNGYVAAPLSGGWNNPAASGTAAQPALGSFSMFNPAVPAAALPAAAQQQPPALATQGVSPYRQTAPQNASYGQASPQNSSQNASPYGVSAPPAHAASPYAANTPAKYQSPQSGGSPYCPNVPPQSPAEAMDAFSQQPPSSSTLSSWQSPSSAKVVSAESQRSNVQQDALALFSQGAPTNFNVGSEPNPPAPLSGGMNNQAAIISALTADGSSSAHELFGAPGAIETSDATQQADLIETVDSVGETSISMPAASPTTAEGLPGAPESTSKNEFQESVTKEDMAAPVGAEPTTESSSEKQAIAQVEMSAPALLTSAGESPDGTGAPSTVSELFGAKLSGSGQQSNRIDSEEAAKAASTAAPSPCLGSLPPPPTMSVAPKQASAADLFSRGVSSCDATDLFGAPASSIESSTCASTGPPNQIQSKMNEGASTNAVLDATPQMPKSVVDVGGEMTDVNLTPERPATGAATNTMSSLPPPPIFSRGN